jgi:hypothetical protein
MVIRLDIEIWVTGKGGTKNREWEKGGVCGGRSMGAAGFCGPGACLGACLLLLEHACGRDLRGLGFCTVDIVG